MGKTRRRFADRPRVTIRALMWFVLVVALSNGLCMMVARRLHASPLPIERIRRMELVVFLFLNANALLLSLYFFYAPWLGGKTRKEWLKNFFMRRIPFLVFFGTFQWFMQAVIRGQGFRTSLSILVILFMVVLLLAPLVFVAVLIVQHLRRSRSGAAGFAAPQLAEAQSWRAPETEAVSPDTSPGPG